jgi:hypothetical protein
MSIMDEKILRELRAGLFTPACVSLVLIPFVVLAYYWSMDGEVGQLDRVMVFAIMSLFLLHLAASFCSSRTNDKSLKFLEWMFLGFAFVGIYGVVEVEGPAVRAHAEGERYILVNYLEILANKCSKIDPSGCETELRIVASAKNFGWNESLAEELRQHLEGAKKVQTEDEEQFWGALAALKARNDYFARLSITEASSVRFKVLGFYLLVLGLSLRIIKTSIELFEWHRPKIAKP